MPATEKISLTMGREELRRAKSAANRYGVSLSAFVTAAVRARLQEQERRQAAEEILSTFTSEERATAEERAELLALWTPGRGKARARRRRRKKT